MFPNPRDRLLKIKIINVPPFLHLILKGLNMNSPE